MAPGDTTVGSTPTPEDFEQLLEHGRTQRAFDAQGHDFLLDFELVAKLISPMEWRA